MNILLVYPEMPQTYFKLDNILKILGKKMSFAPVGLLTVASMLPKEWNKKLIDKNVKPLLDSDVEWADLVMISAMNAHVPGIAPVIEQCKKFNKKIAAGGPLFTHEHLKFPEIDYFILNEAEITLQPFINDFIAGKPKKIYSSKEFASVTESPLPDWSLVNKNDYAYGTVQYSRGCPYMCDFCDVTALFGRKPRVKTPEQVIAELEILLNNGKFENIIFADDNFMGNKRVLKSELLPALIEWRDKHKYAPAFSTQITINVADDEELMQMLLEAGFRQLLIGIESISEESLKLMRKNQNTGRNILADLHKIQQRGFLLMTGYIVGLDDDKETVFRDQVNFIQESGVIMNIINILKAPPGTELYDRMERENRLLPEFDFVESRSNIITKMKPEVLASGLAYVMGGVYSPQAAYERYMKYFGLEKKSKVRNPIQRKITLAEIPTIFRIVRYLTFDKDVGKHFRKLMFYVWKHERQNLDKGVLFGMIMQHQFEQWKRLEKVLNEYPVNTVIEKVA